eukprot:358302-Chlamydomonas_euryale.AAC.2
MQASACAPARCRVWAMTAEFVQRAVPCPRTLPDTRATEGGRKGCHAAGAVTSVRPLFQFGGNAASRSRAREIG